MADDTSITRARSLLTPPAVTASPWTMLAAAALAACAAVLMAGVTILGPGVRLDESAAVQPVLPNG